MILTVHDVAGAVDVDLAAIGIKPDGRVFRNLSVAELYEHALRRDEGALGANGQMIVDTGKHTGRSPKDKFFVKEPVEREIHRLGHDQQTDRRIQV